MAETKRDLRGRPPKDPDDCKRAISITLPVAIVASLDEIVDNTLKAGEHTNRSIIVGEVLGIAFGWDGDHAKS